MSNITEEFRFAMLDYEPHAFPCANHTPFSVGRTLRCPHPGAAYELFQIYVQAMRVRPKLMWLDAEALGSYENGSWSGALGMVLNGTLDTLAVPYQRTGFRERFFDFSYSFYETKLVYMAKEITRSGFDSILDIFSPFSLGVWLMYLATIIALLITFLFINVSGVSDVNGKRKAHLEGDSSSKDVAWNFFRYLIHSCGKEVRQKSLSVKIVFITGGIFVLVMMNLYGGVLLSELIYDHRQQPFTTADDVLILIERGKYKLIFDRSYASFWYHQETATSNDTHYVQLRKALAKNPYAYVDNKTQAMKMVLDGGHILPTLTDDSMLHRAFNLCDVDFISPAGTPLKLATYLFPKKSQFIKRFNAAIFSSQRLTDRIWTVYYGDIAEQGRANYCKRPSTRSSLSLDACIGLFTLLLIGSTSGAAVLIAEIARQKWIHRKVERFDDDDLTTESSC